MSKSAAQQVNWAAVAAPTSTRGTLPLRVAVYTAIARAIRSGNPGPGDLLPNEPELCAAFGVSRTVVREALIMLEEDLLVRTRRGIGRFVADTLPASGIEQLRPIEKVLARDDEPEVRRLKAGHDDVTDFTGRGLDVEEQTPIRMWESVILRDDEPIALSQEWIPPNEKLSEISAALGNHGIDAPHPGRTMLAVLLDLLGSAVGPGSCDIAVSTAGRERGQALHTPGSAAILVLTQSVLCEGRPLYLAKHLIRPEAGHLTVVQSIAM